MPRTTSTFASPRSASTSMTSRPCAAMDTARLADTVVLPTPPFPPVTAMTLTGREALSFARASSRSGESLLSRMGVPSGKGARKIPIVAQQPNPLLMRGVQVRRYPLSVAKIGDLQPMTQGGGYHGAQTRRLIDLGDDAGRRRCPGEGSDYLIERMSFALRRKRQ